GQRHGRVRRPGEPQLLALLLDAREPEIAGQHVDEGVEQVGGTRLVARHDLDRTYAPLQVLLLLSVALAFGNDRFEPSDLFLIVFDLATQARDLGRQRQPGRPQRENDDEPQRAEDDTQVDAGDTEPLRLARGRSEIDLDHAALSPGVRSPRPTATANSG